MINLIEAAAIIRAGGVVAYPTESFYALGADATNARAVRKVFNLKGRGKLKPIALIAGNQRQVERFFTITKAERSLARRYWPGAVTILLRPKKVLAADALLGTTPSRRAKRSGHPSLERRGSNGIGVRVPRHRVAVGLARLVGRPITATSANLSGGRPTKSARRVRAWWPDVPVVAGACGRATKPSTVVMVEGRSLLTIRPGAVKGSI